MSETVSELACVLLAAGASTRLGQPKQLVEMGGETLLKRSARFAHKAGCDPVIAVLGFEAERMLPELQQFGTIIVTNEEWRSGMGSSLRCGIEALTRIDPLPANVLLLVCDQLALNVDMLKRLIAKHRSSPAPITASRYGGGVGVPAIFSSSLFADLMAVSGDRGARGVLEAHADQVVCVDFPGGEADLDIPAQLKML